MRYDTNGKAEGGGDRTIRQTADAGRLGQTPAGTMAGGMAGSRCSSQEKKERKLSMPEDAARPPGVHVDECNITTGEMV